MCIPARFHYCPASSLPEFGWIWNLTWSACPLEVHVRSPPKFASGIELFSKCCQDLLDILNWSQNILQIYLSQFPTICSRIHSMHHKNFLLKTRKNLQSTARFSNKDDKNSQDAARDILIYHTVDLISAVCPIDLPDGNHLDFTNKAGQSQPILTLARPCQYSRACQYN